MNRHAHLEDKSLYQRFYEALGAHSKAQILPKREPRMAWALQNIRPTDDVIDIGCDKGQMTIPVRQATTGKVYGLELSQASIDYNQKNPDAAFITWLHGWAEDVPLPDNSVDVALLCEILEHVVDPAVCITEAERVTRPGGTIVISVPIDAAEMERHGGCRDNRNAGFADLDGHVRDYRPDIELRRKKDAQYFRAEVKDGDFSYRWWLAAYTVEKGKVAAA